MSFPLSLWDLMLWLAVTAIILLPTYELLYSYSGSVSILINKKRFRKVAVIIGILFILGALVRFYEMMGG